VYIIVCVYVCKCVSACFSVRVCVRVRVRVCEQDRAQERGRWRASERERAREIERASERAPRERAEKRLPVPSDSPENPRMQVQSASLIAAEPEEVPAGQSLHTAFLPGSCGPNLPTAQASHWAPAGLI
jgi:hypothetical protein